MTGVSKQLSFLAVAIGSLGVLYFLTLAAGFPFWITTGLYALVLVGAGRWMREPAVPDERSRLQQGLFWAGLVAGIVLITNRAFYTADLHGGWDAWGMWNLKAQALSDGRYWTVVLREAPYQHNDYPLLLPSFNAFWMRLFGSRSVDLVPFATAFLTTLLVPVWIYTRLAARSWPLALAVLLLFATDDAYLSHGLAQYADGLLGLFFLAALLHREDARATDRRTPAVLTGFFLGCCLWTKNEGAVLALLALLFWGRSFWMQKKAGAVLAGLAVPVAVWVLFKIGWPTPSDMLQRHNRPLHDLLLDGSRYQAVWTSLKNLLSGPFRWTQWVFWTAAGVLLVRRRGAVADLLLILTCLLAYCSIYLVTPHDIDWHLATSHDRLLFQLQPAFVYAAARLISTPLPANAPR